MAIEKIDHGKCIGCATCVKSCPMDVIRMDSEAKKAVIKYQEDCIMCAVCVADCPAGAITLLPGKSAVWFASGY